MTNSCVFTKIYLTSNLNVDYAEVKFPTHLKILTNAVIRIVLQATDTICECNQQQEDHVLTAGKDMAFVAWPENVGDIKINLCLSTQ